LGIVRFYVAEGVSVFLFYFIFQTFSNGKLARVCSYTSIVLKEQKVQCQDHWSVNTSTDAKGSSIHIFIFTRWPSIWKVHTPFSGFLKTVPRSTGLCNVTNDRSLEILQSGPLSSHLQTIFFYFRQWTWRIFCLSWWCFYWHME